MFISKRTQLLYTRWFFKMNHICMEIFWIGLIKFSSNFHSSYFINPHTYSWIHLFINLREPTMANSPTNKPKVWLYISKDLIKKEIDTIELAFLTLVKYCLSINPSFLHRYPRCSSAVKCSMRFVTWPGLGKRDRFSERQRATTNHVIHV